MSAQLLKEKNIFIFCLAVRIVEVFYETSSTPLKGKELAWIGDMGIVSISSGLSTLNNRVGIIHILLSSRFTTLHLTLNPNQYFKRELKLLALLHLYILVLPRFSQIA